MSRAAALYKKKDGFVSIADDRKHLFWTPTTPENASPAFTLAIADIGNLQQSPATAPKARLRIVVPPGSHGQEQLNHDFTFTSTSAAREEQSQITNVLRDSIAAIKNATGPPVMAARPTSSSTPATEGGQPAAMAIAHAVSAPAIQQGDEIGWYDDNKLMADLELHRSLLEANPMLRQRFTHSSRDRPNSITISQFSKQFWTPRLHLLRAHAIEKAQHRGEYNVLPEIKMTSVPSGIEGQPNTQKLELSKDQIKLLFRQHRVIRAAYNDNVGSGPGKMNHAVFWSAFFNSRLYWKLRGIKQPDALPDPVFDRYLDFREDGPTSNETQPVPHFIDLEGNEQNHSQRKGNMPDVSMRPRSHDRVPMLRRLNGLSEKLLASVAPSDGPAHAPIGMDEDTYNQLRLRDLQAYDGDNRVKLTIRDQRQLQSSEGQKDELSADAALYAQQSLPTVLANMKAALAESTLGANVRHGLSLEGLIGVDMDDDDVEEEQTLLADEDEFGSSRALKAVTNSLIQSIRRNKTADPANDASTCGLTQGTFEELTMTQNTTVEFLHFFWSLYLSGDGTRANELGGLIETLNNSLERIDAVAIKAEGEKKVRARGLKDQVEAAREGSAKRRRLELELQNLGGGKGAVQAVLRPTLDSIAEATHQYRRAFEEQSAMAAAIRS